jgi:hypothetical protein
MDIGGKLKRMEEEMVVAYVKVLAQHFPGSTEEVTATVTIASILV